MRKPADNTALLRAVSAKAKAITARRAEDAAARRAPPPSLPAGGQGRGMLAGGQGRGTPGRPQRTRASGDPREVLDRATTWASEDRPVSFFVEDASEGSEGDYDEGDRSDGDTVIDLAYIVQRRPSANVVRGYLRAQALCVEETLDDAI